MRLLDWLFGRDEKIKTIQLRYGDDTLNFGDDGLFIVSPDQAGNTINVLRNGTVNKITTIQVSPDAQETLTITCSNNIGLEGNSNWEMTNKDVLVLIFLTPEKAIEISRTNR